uniref:50S ribosomal protein L35 n=1 Tax=Halydictyon mirabile TaxID=189652 RepID=A0A4D6WUM8_9FLOR|nr:ribosomal protein L35 [Halydictyon mirabile]
MYKLKTSKSISKRFKVTSKSKLLRHQASRNHLLAKKSSKHKSKLRKTLLINICNISNLKNSLTYNL